MQTNSEECAGQSSTQSIATMKKKLAKDVYIEMTDSEIRTSALS